MLYHQFYVKVFGESFFSTFLLWKKTSATLGLWHDIWPRNKCSSLWPIFHGWQIVGRTSVSLVTLTCWSWSEGQHHSYFTVQWFCLISWRLFDVWTSFFGLWVSMTWRVTSKWINFTVTYISWSSDFVIYLEYCLMYEHHTLELWVSTTQHLTSK